MLIGRRLRAGRARPSTATASSGASAPGSTATAARAARAPASGWRSCASSSSCTAARSRSATRAGGGALFTVTLPLRPPDGDARARHARPARRGRAAHRVRPLAARGGARRRAAPTAGADGRHRRARPRRARRRSLAGIGDARGHLRRRATPRRRCGWPSSCAPTRSSSAPSTGDMPATSLLRRLAADARLAGVRRVALAGEREEDPSPEALITRGRAARAARRRRRGARRAACGCGGQRRLDASATRR